MGFVAVELGSFRKIVGAVWMWMFAPLFLGRGEGEAERGLDVVRMFDLKSQAPNFRFRLGCINNFFTTLDAK